MDKQEIFDKVLAHAAKQGKKAVNNGTCLYRGPNGTMCFIGALISDSDYTADMEDSTLKGILEKYPDIVDPLLPSNMSRISAIEFLANLQHIHDKSFVTGWVSDFEHFAMVHKINMPKGYTIEEQE